MKSEPSHFPGAHGQTLAGRLESPLGEPLAYALFAHCFTCSKDLKAAGWICRALAERGIAVLRFDFSGVGGSEGEGPGGFASNLEDVVAAAPEHFRERPALGFSDCLILEVARKAGHLPLGTFDRELDKLAGTQKL